MAAEKLDHPQVRAYLEYFRDMGVYDFYRNGEPLEYEAAAPVAVQERVAEAPARLAEPVQVGAPVQAAALVDEESLIARPVSFNDLAPVPVSRIAAADRAAALAAIRADLGDCTRCPLAYGGRRNIVYGEGDPNARLMFVGEGPGADEDETGRPFIGKSGQLLGNMIAAMGLTREQVYIANIVKCRPPANRAPEPAEANVCTQFLVRQMDVVRPEYIVALGATAATYLLGVKQSLASLRGFGIRCVERRRR